MKENKILIKPKRDTENKKFIIVIPSKKRVPPEIFNNSFERIEEYKTLYIREQPSRWNRMAILLSTGSRITRE